jgi:L-lactate utilization protein LutB
MWYAKGDEGSIIGRLTASEPHFLQVPAMRIGLFIPCYIDHLYPDVGMATVEVLEKLGVEIDFPEEQTCCGQPMANTGCQPETRPLAVKFLKIFRDYPYVVCPSGSCVAMVRHHYREHLEGQPGFEELVGKTYELCEFLVDVMKVALARRIPVVHPGQTRPGGPFGRRVGTLRETASQIKLHTLTRLPEYLEQFEQNARRLGAHVHWARDAAEHNEIVLKILQERGIQKLVKSKSMLTEECHLNPYLIQHGIEVIDTDLGERIVQLREEPPSHIVLPAIHIKKEEVGELFHQHLGTEQGATDPKYLTEAARGHLREKFMQAEAGLSGVNFAVAETGGLVVCTNEGNADLGTSLPKLHIACMGIEKLIPRSADLGVFLRLLARSATGQPITAYTSHFHGPMPGGELHIVLVDNGRSRIRADRQFWESLKCIRCGACMNTCPVYRRSGGFSYTTPSLAPSDRCWDRCRTRRRTIRCRMPAACAVPAPTSAPSRFRSTNSCCTCGEKSPARAICPSPSGC